ncbi:MAG TPA: aminotransferase class I/II-fold pyridoxal phosphate-dependent enzyme [Pseudonocardiaceae bacterium]
MSSRASQDVTVRQGGDLRGLPDADRLLDLSTCANRYGPPPAVAAALRSADPARLLPHPYQAEELFVTAYADYLDVPAADLVAGRGITDFLTMFARTLPRHRVAVLTPDYTDTMRLFGHHLPAPADTIDTAEGRLARLADAMRRYDHLVLSNPNNPLGIHIPPDELAAVCRARPRSTLIVDEAYADFTAEGTNGSMVRTCVRNLVVLLSPNKLFGIAGTRTGALWTHDARLRAMVAAQRVNWPISHLDALVAHAALHSAAWAAETRTRLLRTARRMETLLSDRYPGAVTGVPVHFRFVHTGDPVSAHADLLRAGVVVRAFAGRKAGSRSGLRVTAPTEAEFPALAAALGMR